MRPDLQVSRCIYRITDPQMFYTSADNAFRIYKHHIEYLQIQTLQLRSCKCHTASRCYGITDTILQTTDSKLQVDRNDSADLQILALHTYRCHTKMDRYTTDIKTYLLIFMYISVDVRLTGNTRFLPVHISYCYY